MKTKNQVLSAALIAGLGLIPAGRVTAQIFKTIYGFSALSTNSSGVHTNSEGGGGNDLILSGSTLYGTAGGGGSSGNGTVFAVNTDGTGFRILHTFTPLSGFAFTNSDGALPNAGLILSGNSLYGIATGGGSSGNGTVFKVSIDSTGFTTLHSFTDTSGSAGYYGSGTNSDGASPYAALTILGNTLYGTARGGGSSGNGTVFAINTDGTGFTNLHSFMVAGLNPSSGYSTNSDGLAPNGLILSGKTVYGTASEGGSSGSGTLFAVGTDGTGFTTLYSFVGGSDGGRPYAALILSGNTLYGTAAGGGLGGGAVFKVNIDGAGFTNLHRFPEGAGFLSPHGSLLLSGTTLYGTAGNDLIVPFGILFAVNTDGSGFTALHTFSGKHLDGAYPGGGLILSGNTLYGTFASISSAAVFSLSFPPPPLAIVSSGANAILTWPANYAGFDYAGYTLQSTTNLVSPAVWTTVSSGPVVVTGQNRVTNPISGTQRFYRLSRQ